MIQRDPKPINQELYRFIYRSGLLTTTTSTYVSIPRSNPVMHRTRDKNSLTSHHISFPRAASTPPSSPCQLPVCHPSTRSRSLSLSTTSLVSALLLVHYATKPNAEAHTRGREARRSSPLLSSTHPRLPRCHYCPSTYLSARLMAGDRRGGGGVVSADGERRRGSGACCCPAARVVVVLAAAAAAAAGGGGGGRGSRRRRCAGWVARRPRPRRRTRPGPGGRGGGRAVVGGLARAEAEEGEGEEEGEGRRRRGRWRRPPRGWRDRRRRVVRAWDTVRRGGVVRGLRGGAAPDGGERPWRRRGEAAQRGSSLACVDGWMPLILRFYLLISPHVRICSCSWNRLVLLVLCFPVGGRSIRSFRLSFTCVSLCLFFHSFLSVGEKRFKFNIQYSVLFFRSSVAVFLPQSILAALKKP